MDATMLERLENEQAHSKFLEELLKTLYGKGWDKLTIPEAQKHREKVKKLEGWLKALVPYIERSGLYDDFIKEVYAYIKAMEGK